MLRKAKPTNAKHRGGCVRSSDEELVMSLERRGAIIQFGLLIQPVMEGN